MSNAQAQTKIRKRIYFENKTKANPSEWWKTMNTNHMSKQERILL